MKAQSDEGKIYLKQRRGCAGSRRRVSTSAGNPVRWSIQLFALLFAQSQVNRWMH